jgi:hypothetical protein
MPHSHDLGQGWAQTDIQMGRWRLPSLSSVGLQCDSSTIGLEHG